MIAAFGNFYVSEMRRRKSEARRVVIGNVRGPRRNKVVAGIDDATRIDLGVGVTGFNSPGYNFLYNRSKLTDLIEADKRLHLRHLLPQFSRKPLRHAAAHDQLLVRSFAQPALLMRFQNRLNRFFFR